MGFPTEHATSFSISAVQRGVLSSSVIRSRTLIVVARDVARESFLPETRTPATRACAGKGLFFAGET